MVSNGEDEFTKDRSSKIYWMLSHPPEGEDLVITGMSGQFPNSNDIYHFRDNLFDKVDLITEDQRRWKPTVFDMPHRTGKLNDISNFDAGFFGISSLHANNMDIYIRKLLESTYEAIMDAGYDPSELAGTRTGVFIATCSSEMQDAVLYQTLTPNGHCILGLTQSMIAHYISYFFRFQGPSYTTDSACSSTLSAIVHAYNSIRLGYCDMAIVGGANVCLTESLSLQFARLGALSDDGRCKVFDNDANGYVRSEATSAILLQKSKVARRLYAHILHSKMNCDGYKEHGITFPSSEMQKVLLKEVYKESKIDVGDVDFFEAHGTGTKIGDPVELSAVIDVFCPQREKPLYIGSVKSNAGHTESVAGLTGVVKVLVGMETGYIPPNIHFSKPKEGFEALVNGQLLVVTEKTLWPSNNGIAGINSFGFGGANSHLILRWNMKEKINMALPEDNLPRLVCVSGRTEQAINAIWNDLNKRSLDVEFIKILHAIFQKNISNHLFRGYQILGKNEVVERRLPEITNGKPKLVLVFNNFDSSWPKIGKQLLSLRVFADSLAKIQNELCKSFKYDLFELVRTFKQGNVIDQILTTVAIQISLTMTLNVVGISADFFVGLGTGELIAAYFEGYLSLSDVLHAYLQIGYTLSGNNNEKNYKELVKKIKKYIPSEYKSFKKWLPLHRKDDLYTQGSPEYFARNILTPLNFCEAVEEQLLNVREVLIIGAPIGNYENLGKRSEDSVLDLLLLLGDFYLKGYDLQLEHLYKKTSWPVSRGTPMVSPLIKWNYSRKWLSMAKTNARHLQQLRILHIDIKDKEWKFIADHIIDGRILVPATGYLYFAWESLAKLKGKQISKMKVIFEDVKFLRAINLTNNTNTNLVVGIQEGSNRFEISENEAVVCVGTIYEVETIEEEIPFAFDTIFTNDNESITLEGSEIYRELLLRGYNYKGNFKGMHHAISDKKAYVKWLGNWITFMDTLLHLYILFIETKNLYVPTNVKYVAIDPIKHLKMIKQEEAEILLPVQYHLYEDYSIARSGGITIRGIKPNSITKRKHEIPVLETNKFVPYKATLPLDQCLRVIVQVILENKPGAKLKTVEIANESELVSPYISKTLKDLPLIKGEITVLTKNPPDLSDNTDVTFEDRNLDEDENSDLVISHGFETIALSEATNTYILIREKIDFEVSPEMLKGLTILCEYATDSETLILLRKSTEFNEPTVMEVSEDFTWLTHTQDVLKKCRNLILFSQNKFTSGILGLINCLRREPNGTGVSCFFVVDDAPIFDISHPFYEEQIQKGLAFNVWKDGKWGSYRYLLIEKNKDVPCKYCFVNVTVPGDLSSVRFIEGNLNKEMDTAFTVYVYWTALNFRDILMTTGRIPVEAITKDRAEQECLQGFEFIGRDIDGKRVMGIATGSALASHVFTKSGCIWRIPEQWTMEEAATVPVVYVTLIYALFMRATIKHGQSILIHSGTGAIGQAAINIALHFGCNIFVTVGSIEKKDFLREKYPQIKDTHIGNSHDTSFEQMVHYQTNGRGVDIVLNSLAEEKLLASVRCLAKDGHFLELGKFDLDKNNDLSMEMFRKAISFHGIAPDILLVKKSGLFKKLGRRLIDLIKQGAVKPLPRTIFKKGEIVNAFKYLSSGKHMGKVLVNIRKEEAEKICPSTCEMFMGLPRYYCDWRGVYVILGGLGGFGLQLVDWLVMRGARKLILISRSGIKTGYQAMQLRLWRCHGAEVFVRTDDVSTRNGCIELITYACSLGPVKAIFNLAVVLKDALFENQSIENFRTSMAPKAIATQHLDDITRTMCPELSEFVVFSSLSCGRGNAGQTNYGMANSVMERICEQRKAAGYPALAIQWGAIGDVGLVAEMQRANASELVIGGTILQRISNCLEILDTFLRQDETIVSSMVIAKKGVSSVKGTNIVEAVLNILGISDIQKINIHSTLPELGMDSIMAMEIKQTLERDYDVFFTAQEFRAMTFAKLQEFVIDKQTKTQTSESVKNEQGYFEIVKQMLFMLGDTGASKEPYIQMGDVRENNLKIYFLPGIEGTAAGMKPLGENMKRNVTCLQYNPNKILHTVEEWAQLVLPYFSENTDNFVFVAHSFGCVIGTELTYLLEQTGRIGKIVFIDGSPDMLSGQLRKQFGSESEADFETNIICTYMSNFLPMDTVLKHKLQMIKCTSLEERIKTCASSFQLVTFSKYLMEMCAQCFRRVKAVVDYSPKFPKLKSKVKLIKSNQVISADLIDDYGLSNLFENVAEIETFDGDHLTVLKNPDVARAVVKFITDVEDIN